MQGWKKSGLAALLLMAVMACYLSASEPEEELQLVRSQEAPERQEERPVHQAVEGSERAASASLGDPFTMLHETREEKAKAASKPKTAEAERKPTSPEAPQQPAAVPAIRPPAPVEPQLKGIISGGAGQLVLLDYGDKSLTIAVGEEAEGIKVEAVDAKRVLVSTPQGEKWLELP